MHPNPIRSALRNRPFRPFTIHAVSGEKYRVSHPDYAWQTPGGQTVIVAVEDDVIETIDTGSISEIIIGASRPDAEPDDSR